MAPITKTNTIVIDTSSHESEVAENLVPFVHSDRKKFEDVIALTFQKGRKTRPNFPDVHVASVPIIPTNEVDEFRTKHIDSTYHRDNPLERRWRWQFDRKVQYTRWHWAVQNVNTWVNVLRVAGFPDDRIQRMFHGTPLCFNSDEDYCSLRVALRDLKPVIEEDLGWSEVQFVITGSSVPGFSQNPLKGRADIPTKITDPLSSDVDIVVVAKGVDATVIDMMKRGEEEPKFCFQTTSTENAMAHRYGFKDLGKLSKVIEEFWIKWEEILPGGLQLTFAENNFPTPPWESHIDIDNV